VYHAIWQVLEVGTLLEVLPALSNIHEDDGTSLQSVGMKMYFHESLAMTPKLTQLLSRLGSKLTSLSIRCACVRACVCMCVCVVLLLGPWSVCVAVLLGTAVFLVKVRSAGTRVHTQAHARTLTHNDTS